MKMLYNNSKYENITVSELSVKKVESTLVLMKAKLCLTVKGDDGTFIEDVFIEKVKTGRVASNWAVKSDSGTFEPIGK